MDATQGGRGATALDEQIAALSDDGALSALALVADRHGLSIDAATIATVEHRVREAVEQPELERFAPPTGTAISQGDVARSALAHLASAESYRGDVERALALTQQGERLDPGTLAIGALVLFAFHSDIELRKEPDRGWYFHFKVKALSESTFGKVLRQLFGVYTK